MNTLKQIENAMSKEAFLFQTKGFNGPEHTHTAEKHGSIYYVSHTSEDSEHSPEEVRALLENNKWIIC